MRVFGLGGFILFFGNAAAATTYRVDKDATGAEDGMTWCTAYRTVQSALFGAGFGDIVLVADGTYYPDEGTG